MKGILKISLGLYALFIMQLAQAQLKKIRILILQTVKYAAGILVSD